MGQRQPTGSIEILVQEIAGRSVGDDLVEWAVRALVEGFDSPALRRLAGLDKDSWFEAKPLFDRAVQELRLELPSTKELLLRDYLRVIAREMLDGRRQPVDALQIIHSQVLTPLHHPEDLMPWCYLWEGLEPGTFASLTDSQRDEATRQLAGRTLDGKESS